jgi:integrase
MRVGVDLFAFTASRPLSRSSLMEWRAGIESLSPSTINVRLWSVVEQSSKEIGIEHFGAHELRRTCAKLCRKMAEI